MFDNWENIQKLLRAARESKKLANKAKPAVARVLEWMNKPEHLPLKAQVAFLYGISKWWEQCFACAQSGDDSQTQVSGFRAHRVAVWIVKMRADLDEMKSAVARKLSSRFSAYYTILETLDEAVKDKAERQADFFVETMSFFLEKHARAWESSHMYCALVRL